MVNRSLFTLLLALFLSASLSASVVVADWGYENGKAFADVALDSAGLSASSYDTDADDGSSAVFLWPVAALQSGVGESLPPSPFLLRTSERPPARASPDRL